MGIEGYGVLHRDDDIVARRGREVPIQALDASSMAPTEGGHLNDVPVNQLDALVLAEDP